MQNPSQGSLAPLAQWFSSTAQVEAGLSCACWSLWPNSVMCCKPQTKHAHTLAAATERLVVPAGGLSPALNVRASSQSVLQLAPSTFWQLCIDGQVIHALPR